MSTQNEAERLADYLDELFDADGQPKQAAAELRRLSAANAELVEALRLALQYFQHRQQRYKNRHPVWVQEAEAAITKHSKEQPVSLADELPKGFVPLQQENGKVVYAACMDPSARHYKWLMWRHPDGQWVSKRKMEDWEVMQVEDQAHYGIVQEAAHGIGKGKA